MIWEARSSLFCQSVSLINDLLYHGINLWVSSPLVLFLGVIDGYKYGSVFWDVRLLNMQTLHSLAKVSLILVEHNLTQFTSELKN